MALMKFREPNQVAWVGCRPAHRGTQIAKFLSVNNASGIVHTVASGKTFFLNLSVVMCRTGAGSARLSVRNDSDVHQYFITLIDIITAVGTSHSISIPYPYPLEIPSLWDVVIESTAAGCNADAHIHGWEE